MPMMPTMTIGTLMKNTEPQSLPVSHWNQFGCSSSTPPSTGPSATAPPTAAAQTPIALPRSCGGKMTVMMESEIGITDAPPTPIRARKAINSPGLVANAHSAEAKPNSTRPISRILLRPNRSPITPQVNSRAANASE